jgi:ketosteroid isomerase-like protein
MGEQQNLATYRRLWDAYATGRLWVMLDELAQGAEWRPARSERSYVGHEQIVAWAEQVNRRFKSVTMVFQDVWADGPDCVVSLGHTVMYDTSGRRVVDTDVGWVCEFGSDGLITRLTAFEGHEATRRFPRERPALSSPG